MSLLKPSNNQNSRRWPMIMVVLCLGVISQLSFAGSREQAKRMHDRLAGVPPTNTVLDQMEALMGSDPEAAAAIAMQNPAFYNVTLKNFATPWTNEEQTVFAPLNDYSATVIGMIRDNKDFREVLYGNYLYKGTAAYNPNNNTHYEDLEDNGVDLSNPANLFEVPQTSVNPGVAPAGIMTTRAAARAFFVDGTNRAMLRFTFINHLCLDFEQIKDNSRPSDRIRQDVTRSPGGDSRIFNNECLACHAGMDPLNQAYAYYEWDYSGDPDTGSILYTPGQVTAKHLINPDNFKYGYVIQDDSWSNYWRHGPNKNRIGWGSCPGFLDAKGICHGNGAASMGQELANSDAFASCQVQKVFKTVCFRQPTNTELASITGSFELDYNMKNVFAKAAVACMGN
jgi:hypothetical protein